jgi:hypothetical protein
VRRPECQERDDRCGGQKRTEAPPGRHAEQNVLQAERARRDEHNDRESLDEVVDGIEYLADMEIHTDAARLERELRALRCGNDAIEGARDRKCHERARERLLGVGPA